MKALDRILQRWRIRKAVPYIKPGTRVLDIGCADGELFRQLAKLTIDIKEGVGLDPELPQERSEGTSQLIRGAFPDGLKGNTRFDVIVMLAVFEHFLESEQIEIARHCAKRLENGGYVILTVPSPLVDSILDVLMFFRLLDGMETEQHHQFDVRKTPELFSRAGLKLVAARKFELGLNNLFVFQKPPAEKAAAG